MKIIRRRSGKMMLVISASLLGYVIALMTFPFSYQQQKEEDTGMILKVISDMIPKVTSEMAPKVISERTPKIILLWTTWRSGSTFFGTLLAKATENTFYSSEPLHKMKVRIMNANDSTTLYALNYTHNLLRCRLHHEEILFQHLIRQRYYRKANRYVFKKCKERETCGVKDFTEICMKANVHVIKLIRLSLKWVWPLLKDDTLDLKVIYLARDPRAVLLSRTKDRWCKSDSCRDPNVVCDLLQEDLQQAEALTQNFPNKFKFVQYERITQDPDESLKDIMSFLQLPISEEQLKILHPSNLESDIHGSILRDPKTHRERWRITSDYESVLPSQRACLRPLRRLRLRVFHSESEFRNLSLPLLLSEH